jgi:O-antigen ligase
LKLLFTLILLLPWIRGGNVHGNLNYIVFGAIAICILYIAVKSEVEGKTWKLFLGITLYALLYIVIFLNSIIRSENTISESEFSKINFDLNDEKIDRLKEIIINYNNEFNQNKSNAIYLLNNSINEIIYKFKKIDDSIIFIVDKLIAEQSNVCDPLLPNSVFIDKFNLIDFTIIYLSIFLFVFLNKGNSNFKIYSKVILINCSILSVIGILLKFDMLWFCDSEKIISLFEIPDKRNYFSSFAYKNHWAAFCILCITHGLAILLSNYKRRENLSKKNALLNTLLFSTILTTFFLIDTRSSFFILILLLVFILLFYLRRKSITVVLGILFITFLFLLKTDLHKSNVFKQTYTQFEHYQHGNLPLRLLIWSDCLKQISDKTFFGYGTNSYKALNPIFQSQETVSSRYSVTENAHHEFTPVIKTAHSDFLQSLIEYGFVTFALIIFPLCFYLLHIFIISRSYYIKTLCIGCLMHLFYSIIDLPNKSLANYLLFIFTLVIIICYSRVSVIGSSVKKSS